MALTDPRVTKFAKILVNYSAKAKKGERALIVSDWLARPLALEVYKELLRAGVVEILVHFEVDEQVLSRSYNEFSESYLKLAKPFQINAFPKLGEQITKGIDLWFRLYAQTNTRGFANIDSSKITQRTKIIKPLIDHRVEKTKWVLTEFPTEATAQDADMSLAEREDFVYGSVIDVDWEKKSKEQDKLVKRLNKTKDVHIIGEETDLRLKITARKAENGDGKFNMPDGEVFTSVIEDSTDGFITYTYPAIYLGKEFHKVRLEFAGGRVIKATATKGQEDLNKILDMDDGARIVGELGIGNNFKISKFTKNILFDEKIGGSIHLALGNGYKETGSKNESALHWDMIKDLRKGGELWFDDKLVQKDGKWLVKI